MEIFEVATGIVRAQAAAVQATTDRHWHTALQRHPDTHELTEGEELAIQAEADRLSRDEGMTPARAGEVAQRKFWLGLLAGFTAE